MNRKLLAAAVWCTSVFAQTTPTDVFQKAPPHIDEALRGRVSRFLQAHVDGKYRLANELVAEDSQDFYFEMEKRRYISFEIVKIDYTDNFSKATVLATVEVNWTPSARIPAQRIKAPHKMLWKVDNGDWYWYTVKTNEWDTPWGKMKMSSTGTDPNDPAAQVIAQIRAADPKAILSQISVSKKDISLRSYEDSSDTVEITNSMQGAISLRTEGTPVIGLDLKLDKTTVKSGETAKLTFQYVPVTKQPQPSTTAVVIAEPVGLRFEFNISFANPPVEKK